VPREDESGDDREDPQPTKPWEPPTHPDSDPSLPGHRGAFPSGTGILHTLELIESLLPHYEGDRRASEHALDEAIGLYEQTLADRERILGADHPDTLSSRNNLAGAYESAGRLDEAIGLHEQTLADRERILGADHPNTLTSRNNLAAMARAVQR
jgi:tetratricopeptide (TPR) repeat protein